MEKIYFITDYTKTPAQIKSDLKRVKGQSVASVINSQNIALLRSLQKQRIEIIPILPNFSQYARDMSSGGPIGAILLRFKKLTNSTKVNFLAHNAQLPSLMKMAQKDFATGLKILTELELLGCKLTFRRFIVGDEITDLALAFENKQVFAILETLAKTYRKEIIFKTNNKARLHNFLHIAGITQSTIY